MANVLIQPLRTVLWRGAMLCPILLASCALGPKYGPEGNPKQPGTYAHFKAQPDYPKTSVHWVNSVLLEQTSPANSRVVVSLKQQRGFLMMGDQVVIDYPICSGTSARPTPKGEYKVMEKVVEKSSNRYGRIYDAEGKCVNSDADAFTDPIPEGGKFVGAPMNYWMRLTHDGVGHHIGPVLRRPASHACVRGPSKVIPIVFGKVKVGTEVVIGD
jgi:L,D-transpeptidase catalytic domain